MRSEAVSVQGIFQSSSFVASTSQVVVAAGLLEVVRHDYSASPRRHRMIMSTLEPLVNFNPPDMERTYASEISPNPPPSIFSRVKKAI
jgi:hypothetical protein